VITSEEEPLSEIQSKLISMYKGMPYQALGHAKIIFYIGDKELDYTIIFGTIELKITCNETFILGTNSIRYSDRKKRRYYKVKDLMGFNRTPHPIV